MDKEAIYGLRLENPFFLSTPDVFGKWYSGSSKAKQMKRKRSSMLHATIKGRVMRHNMQTKYNRIRL